MLRVRQTPKKLQLVRAELDVREDVKESAGAGVIMDEDLVVTVTVMSVVAGKLDEVPLRLSPSSMPLDPRETETSPAPPLLLDDGELAVGDGLEEGDTPPRLRLAATPPDPTDKVTRGVPLALLADKITALGAPLTASVDVGGEPV